MALVSSGAPMGHGTMPTSMTGQPDFKSLVLSCNKDGMDALRKGQQKAAFEHFKYAEAILIANQAEGDLSSLLAVTCNNLGCYYKKVGKHHGALSYLRRALKLETDLGTDEVTLAGTHLNICAILSKLDKHDKAVQHALSALQLVDERVNSQEADQVSQDDYSVLAIAYHNVGVERDLLEQYDRAAQAFQRGHTVAKLHLGDDHPLSVALGKNCGAVLKKSQKLSKTNTTLSGTSRSLKGLEGGEITGLPSLGSSLPSLKGTVATPRGGAKDEADPMPSARSLRQEAAEWAQSEEQEWNSFAQSALVGQQPWKRPPQPPTGYPAPPSALTPRAPDGPRPGSGGRGASRDLALNQSPKALCTAKRPPRTPLVAQEEEHPEALMDIVDADRTGHALGRVGRSAPNDFRPNRMIKGTTRCSRVVRRTGVFGSSKHRDQVVKDKVEGKVDPAKVAHVRKCAAEKIQRFWRSWYKYCQENADWISCTWVSATMIQAVWRSYHVRRLKLDKAATHVQRHIRGHLVRRNLRKHAAATSIQRHTLGVITRIRLMKMHKAGLKIGCLGRGHLARQRVRRRRAFLTKTAITLQCATRQFIARKRVGERREFRRQHLARVAAATLIARHARGMLGRRRFAAILRTYMEDKQRHWAATKLQALTRGDLAKREVDKIRIDRLQAMNKAACYVQRLYIGSKTRRRYKELLGAFAQHEAHVVTIQRYARGFLVRLRMWREAMRAEEELWAALEMQRCWRGYLGRVKFEDKYEEYWSKHMAAHVIQRNIRGFVCRSKVGRTRRRVAREEFERARRRFRASQKMQAAARSFVARRAVQRRLVLVRKAAACVQRHWRGHVLRRRLWDQVRELRATMITSHARGFLVRNRRFYLIAKVIMIQRRYRTHLKQPEAARNAALIEMRARKASATKLQRQIRSRAEAKAAGQIRNEDGRAAA